MTSGLDPCVKAAPLQIRVVAMLLDSGSSPSPASPSHDRSERELLHGRLSVILETWLETKPPHIDVYLLKKLRARCTIWQSIEAVGVTAGEIFLSFDDGPNPIDNATARLLDTLLQEGVRGAFCVCGKCVRGAPELVHRMKIEGHMVVNHSYSHQPLAAFSERALEQEINNCDAVIADAVHMPSYRPQFFRSACGWRTPMLDRVLPRFEKQLLPITDFGFDTNINRHNYPKWVDRTLQVAKRDRGGLFVLHDRRLRFWGERLYDPTDKDSSAYRGWVPDAAAQLIRRCREEGFRFLDPQVFAERMKELGARI